MPVNPYFQTGALIGSPGEQDLMDDLVVEGIQVHGIDVLYLPRTVGKLDGMFLEDTLVRFEHAVPIEVYLKSFNGFAGDNDFMSNMGVEIRDQVTFSVARTRFEEELGQAPWNLFRPREGDLVWYPLNQKLFEIRYTDKFSMHYPLGKLYVWDMKCELFEYSNQRISTGIPEIDRVMELSHDELRPGAPSDMLSIDPLDDSGQIADEATDLLDFTEYDVYSEGPYGRR